MLAGIVRNRGPRTIEPGERQPAVDVFEDPDGVSRQLRMFDLGKVVGRQIGDARQQSTHQHRIRPRYVPIDRDRIIILQRDQRQQAAIQLAGGLNDFDRVTMNVDEFGAGDDATREDEIRAARAAMSGADCG